MPTLFNYLLFLFLLLFFDDFRNENLFDEEFSSGKKIFIEGIAFRTISFIGDDIEYFSTMLTARHTWNDFQFQFCVFEERLLVDGGGPALIQVDGDDTA